MKATNSSRKEPLRSCLGCRTKKSKKELIRFVLGEDGQPVCDPTQKKAGRGGYVCRNFSCFEKAAGSGAFARAFKRHVTVQADDYRSFFEEIAADE